MCELLGMSANVPTDICFSFTGLVQRGGVTGPHVDGWGITFYEGKGCCIFKDPQPCSQSKIAQLVQNYPIKSCAVVSHIRQANRGHVALENTHPFTRELWGINWTFAHNGQLCDFENLQTGFFQPIGDTDSEVAFCWILEQLRHKYPNKPENMREVFAYIADLSTQLSRLGAFNMLLSDGRYLMAYSSKNLHWITRRAPFGKAQLLDRDVVIDFQKETSSDDVVTVVATQPLTGNESWSKIEPGTYCLFDQGEKIS
jgi:glutamine amidotransferase